MKRLNRIAGPISFGLLALGFTGTAQAQKIVVGAPVDGVVTVSLETGGASIAGTENVLTFDGGLRISAKTNGRPDCAVNPDIEKTGTGFAYQASGCTGDACTGMKALVLALDNTDPIADGSVLYTCKVTGTGSLGCTAPNGSDPAGAPVALECGPAGGEPTATPTEEPTPPAGPRIIVSDVVDGVVDVSLSAGGEDIAGTENVLTFDGGVRIAAKTNGRPDCTVNADIEKSGTGFAYQPSGCTGDACTSMKALVLALDNTDPIPDGSSLYTCKVTGTGTLNCASAGGSDPAGAPLEMTCGGAAPTPTETEEPATLTPTPTHTLPDPTVTNTVPAAPTNTATNVPTNTRPAAGGNDEDDGCQVTAPAHSNTGWLLLIPGIALFFVRRRSR